MVLLLAGCTCAPNDLLSEAATSQPTPAPLQDARAIKPFAAPPAPVLDVSLEVVERWVRPGDAVVAQASAKAAVFEWYLAPRNPLFEIRDPGPFALADGATHSLDVRREGRHVFGLDGTSARLSVSILEGALPLRLDARLVDEGSGARFAPDELVGGPGSRVSLVNDLESLATLRRADEMIPLRGVGETISFQLKDTVDELGDYDLVVVARDGAGAVGAASARLVYDNRKPDAEHEFGPFRGRFQLPPLPTQANIARHDWTNDHTLRSLNVTLSRAAAGPAPAALRLSLEGPGGTVITTSEDPGFTAEGLPNGTYAFVVEQLGGAFVEYRIEAHGIWDLQPPASFFRRD